MPGQRTEARAAMVPNIKGALTQHMVAIYLFVHNPNDLEEGEARKNDGKKEVMIRRKSAPTSSINESCDRAGG